MWFRTKRRHITACHHCLITLNVLSISSAHAPHAARAALSRGLGCRAGPSCPKPSTEPSTLLRSSETTSLLCCSPKGVAALLRCSTKGIAPGCSTKGIPIWLCKRTKATTPCNNNTTYKHHLAYLVKLHCEHVSKQAQGLLAYGLGSLHCPRAATLQGFVSCTCEQWCKPFCPSSRYLPASLFLKGTCSLLQ